MTASRIAIIGVPGIPEIEPGTSLAAEITAHADLRDGDIVVVTSKIVSKAEGRLIHVDALEREAERGRLVMEASSRIVARRGELVIAETERGFVCANAGVDGSNVPPDTLALLPSDPDGSATRIRGALEAATGRRVAVIITDTFGRPWRTGQVNVALGVAGMSPLRDHRGETDAFGTVLEATVIAVADEIAGAAELVMGKTDAVPVAVVRGLDFSGEGSGRDLIRPADEDLFRTAAVEALEARRSIRSFTGRAVPRGVLERAVEAAATAPAPHHTRPWRFVWPVSAGARRTLVDAMSSVWRADLETDGARRQTIERRLARSQELLGAAPVLLACFVSTSPAERYPDDRRRIAERDMFVASAGAAIQNLMVALSAQGVGSCWVSSSMFCPAEAAAALGLDGDWSAVGCVAAGYPAGEPEPRRPVPADEFLAER